MKIEMTTDGTGDSLRLYSLFSSAGWPLVKVKANQHRHAAAALLADLNIQVYYFLARL